MHVTFIDYRASERRFVNSFSCLGGALIGGIFASLIEESSKNEMDPQKVDAVYIYSVPINKREEQNWRSYVSQGSLANVACRCDKAMANRALVLF